MRHTVHMSKRSRLQCVYSSRHLSFVAVNCLGVSSRGQCLYTTYMWKIAAFFSLSIVGFVGTGGGKTRRHNGRAGRRLLNGRQKEKCDIYNGRVETDAY